MKSTAIKVIALLLTACVFLGVTSCSLFKEEEPEETTTLPSATPLMLENEEVLAYFNAVMEKLKAGKASLKYSSSYDPKDFACEGNDAFAAGLPAVVKLMKDGFNDGLGAEVAYGDPISNYIPNKNTDSALFLTMDDIRIDEKTSEPIIHINKEALSRFEEASSEADAKISEYLKESKPEKAEEVTIGVVLDEDVRKIEITLRDEENPKSGEGLFGKIFNIPDQKKIADEMKAFEDSLTYDGTYKTTYTECSIYMEINRLTDEVTKLEFRRNINVEVQVTGQGEIFGEMGTALLTFTVGGSDVYELDWNDPEATTNAEGETVTRPVVPASIKNEQVTEPASTEEATTAE